ncbi:hypothetical protein NQ318_019796 [Aromia moschata]|uniref:C2H2-type domain-containing protein n=1 Tax=Aromia moschata TaxID=1265417 RepID=A0AAV8YJZ7_9CUCU|nr:hypothetical protein NQ318_019796 [Aromia moschata]
MWTEDYRWHFDYVRLAWDAGFSFEKYKYPNLDKNKICLVDVDRVVRERDVASIERFIPTVVQYILESDQAEVLDTNFVKLFRMSQLSVEYLLFCKKYLDNTVENKELKLFTQDLENHVTTLTKQNNLIATFKCEKCSKAFSTEEYLYSHIKRRHTEENRASTNTETDTLQSEIKELKERLNTTEKLLQEKEENMEKAITNLNADESKIRVDEIQEKFEKFREKVENDLKILQIQKNFYEDKYSKLFDLVIQSNNKENIDSNIVPPKLEPPKEEANNFSENVTEKMENTTQTDPERKATKELQIETVQDRNIFHIKDTDSTESLLGNKENFEETIEKKMHMFEENLESKISSGLNDIQSQMEAFWGRISEMELRREKSLAAQQIHRNALEQVSQSTSEKAASPVEPPKLLKNAPKPEIKPRTRLTKPNRVVKSETAEKFKKELEQMYLKVTPSPKDLVRVKSQINTASRASSAMYDTSVSSEPEDESKSESRVAEIADEDKISTSTAGKRPSPRRKGSAKSQESLDKYREEIADVVNGRLQEMGVSPNWRGIPRKTFDRALAIVRHQANLSKKMYPNYDSIRRSIEKSLRDKDAENRKKNGHKKIPDRATARGDRHQLQEEAERARVGRISGESETKPRSVTIKNRSLYDDTESDRSVLAQNAPKLVRKDSSDTESDLTSTILPKDDVGGDKNGAQIKSAMKNYPSLGSLEKKRVLFDIETDEEARGAEKGENVGESSLRGEQPSRTGAKKDGSLSDFTLSDY